MHLLFSIMSMDSCLSEFNPMRSTPSSCSPFSRADPQGYGISGYLISGRLDVKYVVAILPTPYTVYPIPDIIY